MSMSWNQLKKAVRRITNFNPDMPILLTTNGALFDLESIEPVYHDTGKGLLFELEVE